MSTDSGVLLEVTGLRVSYGERCVSAIDHLDVSVGECVAIVGESGSGKSSALMAILGLIGGRGRVSGRVMIGDIDTVTADERALAGVRGSRIALVMQSPQSALNPVLRLGTLFGHVLRRHGVTGAQAKAAIATALSQVRLAPEILERYPHQVSGGQAQRFSIAIALALGADLLAADEPTSALDVTVQAEIMDLLSQLRHDRGLGILLVSHDLALVSTLADTVVIMRDGVVVEQGETGAVLTHPAESYTRDLLAAVPTFRQRSTP